MEIIFIFQAKFEDDHSELPNGILEFEAKSWHEAIDIAAMHCNKSTSDGIRCLKVVGYKKPAVEIVRY